MDKTKTGFYASQFTPTEWDTAEQKARFANQFVAFVKSDFSATRFPKWFYRQLRNTFGHIAHYDQNGFYATFFTSTSRKARFLEITAGVTGLYADESLGICGDPAFTYSDVERVLRQYVKEHKLVELYHRRLASETEAAERAQLATLQAKYAVVA